MMLQLFFGIMCIAHAIDGTDAPLWLTWNYVVLLFYIAFLIGSFVDKTIIKPISNQIKRFNDYLDKK